MLTTYFSNLLEGFFTVPAAKLQKKKIKTQKCKGLKHELYLLWCGFTLSSGSVEFNGLSSPLKASGVGSCKS